jgi:HK97 family phage major capsid protein
VKLTPAEREALLLEARNLATPNATKGDLKRCDVILATLAESRSADELRAAGTAGENATPEQRHYNEFRGYLRGGSTPQIPKELRSAFDTSTGGVFIPTLWEGGFQSKLVSFSGLREAGCTILSTRTGANMLYPYSDDSANSGIRQAEGVAVNLDVIPSITLNTLGSFIYNSQGVTISKELSQGDIGFDLDNYLQTIFARRIGAITNKEFTQGAGGGPTGVIPGLTSALTTASPTAVTMLELCTLIASVDPAYRDGAKFMFSPGVETVLKSTTSTLSGERLYPEMQDGEILGFEYALNVDSPAALASAVKGTIAFGNFKEGIVIREAQPILISSKERFAEFNQDLFALISRQSVTISDTAAVKCITQHV